MTAWSHEELLAALDCEAAADDPAVTPLARWLNDHPDGVRTAEDFADRPVELGEVEEQVDVDAAIAVFDAQVVTDD